jgi:hypothetical protein
MDIIPAIKKFWKQYETSLKNSKNIYLRNWYEISQNPTSSVWSRANLEEMVASENCPEFVRWGVAAEINIRNLYHMGWHDPVDHDQWSSSLINCSISAVNHYLGMDTNAGGALFEPFHQFRKGEKHEWA